MAFGIFKKKQYADTLLINGQFYTADSEEGKVEALAVKNGRILALGDLDALEEDVLGPETEVMDLGGHFLMPGLVKGPAHPVLDCFRPLCFIIPFQWGRALIQEEAGKALRKKAGLLGYGYNPHLLEGLDPDQMRKELDQVSPIKPIVLLSSDGLQVWVNTPAVEKARRIAEEEGVLQITLPFLLGALELVDFEQLQEQVLLQAGRWCKEGYTALWDTGAPDYFHNLYHEALVSLYQEGFLKQRHFGSLYMDRDVDPKGLTQKLMQNRTLCSEMEGLVHFTTLHLKREEGSPEGYGLTREGLAALATAASERSFHLLLQVKGQEVLHETLETLDQIGSGIGKVPWILSTNEAIPEELRQEIVSIDEIFVIPDLDAEEEFSGPVGRPMKEIAEKFLHKPASFLGQEEMLGVLEPGSYADFVVFDQSPENKEAKVLFTFLNGEPVYLGEQDKPEKWHKEFLERYQEEE
jgi:predicted amidohydrolase YtcJ